MYMYSVYYIYMYMLSPIHNYITGCIRFIVHNLPWVQEDQADLTEGGIAHSMLYEGIVFFRDEEDH